MARRPLLPTTRIHFKERAKPPKGYTRKYGKVNYFYTFTVFTKTMANEKAKKLRKKGWNVRIVPRVRHGKQGYDLYKRKRKRT